MEKRHLELTIIGVIHSPYKTTNDAPFQGSDKVSEIEIFQEFEQGLTDIEGFSHLHVLYWLHLSQGYSLMVQTPWDTTPHGLFTTRSPHRPNPIAYAVVELIERKETRLKVKGLDAIEGTPVIDIKPYISNRDAKPSATLGWLKNSALKRK